MTNNHLISDQCFDYLIVGQGIAGSILAWTLEQRGQRVLIVNDCTTPSSSKVAAGIFNPLTGRKLVLTWKANDILPFAQRFYADLEKSLHTTLLHFCNVYRPYRSIEEQNTCLSQTAEPNLQQYVAETTNDPYFGSFVENPYNGLEITQSGWVNCVELVEKIEKYFLEKNQYLNERFNYELIENQNDGVFYKGIKIKKILFCEGFEARENPFFDWLPHNPAKGQTILVNIEDYTLPEIINQGIFIIPIDKKGLCKVGATYSWDDLDSINTDDARAFLEEKLQLLIKRPYRIIEQQAGVRPATQDRRPFVGLHPEFPHLAIFNGLGSKGVSLAPYFAAQLADFLESDKEIDPLVNIERFFTLYFHKKNP